MRDCLEADIGRMWKQSLVEEVPARRAAQPLHQPAHQPPRGHLNGARAAVRRTS